MFDEFAIFLQKALSQPLPGAVAQQHILPAQMQDRPFAKAGKSARLSSVLMVIYPYQETAHTIFIKRQEYPGVHSGQISFPGGKFEKKDKNLKQTALRETMEEIGLPPNNIRIIGKLSEVFIDRSNHLVQPYIGVAPYPETLTPDSREVNKIIHTSINDLIYHPPIQHFDLPRNGAVLKMPYYPLQGEVLWGATAMMVSEFIEIAKPFFIP